MAGIASDTMKREMIGQKRGEIEVDAAYIEGDRLCIQGTVTMEMQVRLTPSKDGMHKVIGKIDTGNQPLSISDEELNRLFAGKSFRFNYPQTHPGKGIDQIGQECDSTVYGDSHGCESGTAERADADRRYSAEELRRTGTAAEHFRRVSADRAERQII